MKSHITLRLFLKAKLLFACFCLLALKLSAQVVVTPDPSTGSTVLINNGALTSSSNDQIDYVQITALNPTTLRIFVRWLPANTGAYTAIYGVHVKLFHYDGVTWNTVLSKNLSPAQFTLDQWVLDSVDYVVPPLSNSGTNYIRASIIDKADVSDEMTGTYGCGNCGTYPVADRHYDNADVAFNFYTSFTAFCNFAYCNTGGYGIGKVTALYGTPPYSYLWSNGATSDSTATLPLGACSVLVTDAVGATTTCSGTVVSSTPSITPPSATFCGSGVTFIATSSMGYLWSTGATSQSINVSNSGTYTVTVNGCDVVTATATNSAIGNPSVFGNNVWNVYAWNAGDASDNGQSWNANFSGYYVDTNFNFNTTTYWGSGGSPSNASNYQGCVVAVDHHSWSAKREGFPCGYYSINIDSHDDEAELYINGSLVWEHVGCCDHHLNVWTGYLSSASQVEFRCTEGGGGSHGTISFLATPFTITASGTVLCNNNTVTLDATVLPGNYLWSTGQTTSTITTTTSGTYTVSLTDGSSCTLTSSVTLTDVTPPTVTISGNQTICSGASTTLTASGATTYGWVLDEMAVDNISSVQLAVGLHKLKSSYNGFALKLRRSSDNDTLSFGFVGNDLDVASISTWLGGADGYCTILYDQSGNGNHVTQSNNTNQPKYIENGINNKPILRFNTSQTMFNNTNFPAPYSVVYGAKQTGPNRQRVLASRNNNWLLGWHDNNKNRAYFGGWVSFSNTSADNNSTIYSATCNGISSQFYENGSLLANNNFGLAGPDGIQLNGWYGFNEMSDCDFTDVTVFNSVLSNDDRIQVEISIGSYYNIALSGNDNPIVVTPTVTTTYTVTGTDTYGCTATASLTVTVNQLPVITCPADVSTTLATGVCSAVMTYDPATATGNAPLTLSYSQNSGTSYNAGANVVTASVTDVNGCTSDCMFNVNVLDVTPPTISCPAATTVNNDAGICGAIVNLMPTGTDDCPSLVAATATFNYTGTVQTFVVPLGCTSITMSATGAAGGNYNYNSISGGKGATMSGDFAVTPGETLYIMVGQQGQHSYDFYSGGGGGGGTFVTRDAAFITNLLLAAGGGGGAAYNGSSNANITTNGANGSNGNYYYGSAIGGINGNGGQGWMGGGGAGWNGDGSEYECYNRGISPHNGGNPSTNCSGSNGGYGGGAGNYYGAGGGGGYSGGGGGDYDYYSGGGTYAGGGGSYNAGTNQVNTAGAGAGNGLVVINYLQQFPRVYLLSGIPAGGVYPVGTTTNVWMVSDAAGNTATCTSTVTVVDAEPPSLSCTSITVNNEPGQCNAVVNYNLPVVNDNCCEPPTVLAGHTYMGTYNNRTYFKSNAAVADWETARNAAIAAGGQLACINSAGENAFITANLGGDGPFLGGFQNQLNPNYYEPNGGWEWVDGSPFSYTNWSAGEPNDAGGAEDHMQMFGSGNWNDMSNTSNKYIVELSCGMVPTHVSGPASGSTFPIGTTSVSYSVTDAAGLTTSCSFTVTIVDNEAPVIATCSPAQTAYTDGNCQAAVPDFTSTIVASDNCTATNVLTITQSPAAATLKERGTYIITLSVVDASDNTSTCTTTLTILDNVAPVIDCSPIIVNADAGQCSATVNFIAPAVTDNCPEFIANGTETFEYTGTIQTFIVPLGVTSLDVIVEGAQGGNSGGLGGKVQSTLTVTPGQTLNIYVGGMGGTPTAGYNGGGTGGQGSAFYGSGGGGASDIRIGGTALTDRVIVAGGGGGKGGISNGNSNSGAGGAGGGIAAGNGNGQSAACGFSNGGNGAISNAGGVGGVAQGCSCPDAGLNGILGIGGDGAVSFSYGGAGGGGAGGGGYYGGGGAGCAGCPGCGNSDYSAGGGGGGNSYADLVYNTGVVHSQGVRTGNGRIQISYNYSIITTIVQTSGPSSGTNLPVGNHNVSWLATDGSGNTSTCTQTITVVDNQPPVLSNCPVDITTCNNVVNYTESATATDNCALSTITYSHASGATYPDGITVVTVTATDVNGNTATCTFNITVAIAITANVTNVACKGSNSGTIDLTAESGPNTLTYQWSNGSTNADLNNLYPGTYTVTVTGNNGCTRTASFTITQPAEILTISINKTNVRCYGKNTGKIIVAPSGGTLPYSYSWSNGAGNVSSQVNLPAGVYTVTITDATGCVKVKTVTLTQSPNLLLVVTPGPNAGEATASVSGGVPAYTYFWSTSPAQTNATATGLSYGTLYKVKVTDSKNCTRTATIILEPTRIEQSETFWNIEAVPNPTSGFFNLIAECSDCDLFDIKIYNPVGELLLSEKRNSDQLLFDLSNYVSGIYFIDVMAGEKRKTIKLIVE